MRRSLARLGSKMFERNQKNPSKMRVKNGRGNLATSSFRGGAYHLDEPGENIAWIRSTGAVAAGASATVTFDDPVIEGIAGQLIVTDDTGAAVPDSQVTQIQVGAKVLILGDGGLPGNTFNPDPFNAFPLTVQITNEEKVSVTVKNNTAGAVTYNVIFVPLADG